MRVGYDAAPLFGHLTGVGHYALNLFEAMALLDPEIEFRFLAVTVKSDAPRIPKGPNASLRKVRIPARLAVTAWEILGFPDAERLMGPVDVFHGTNFWAPPLKRRASLITIHDLAFWLYPELCTPQIRRYRWIVPRALNRCALVLTPSNTVAEQVAVELGFPRDRIVVTPEGVRGAFKSVHPDPLLLRRLGVDGDYVLFAGTQEPRKNLDRLIEAMGRIPQDTKLVIAGPPGWGSVDLPALSHRLQLDGRIVFSGYLPDPALGSLMAGARAFVFPTLYEGFGLPPLEAMAAGVPVVASSTGAHKEILGDAAVWCDPLDVDSIAQAVTRVVTDEELRVRAIALGKAQASLYTWSETARLTRQAYMNASD